MPSELPPSEVQEWITFSPIHINIDKPVKPTAKITGDVPPPPEESPPNLQVLDVIVNLPDVSLDLPPIVFNEAEYSFNVPSLIPIHITDFQPYSGDMPSATPPQPVHVNEPSIDFSDITFVPAIGKAVIYTPSFLPVYFNFDSFPEFQDLFAHLDVNMIIPDFEPLNIPDFPILPPFPDFYPQQSNFLQLINQEDEQTKSAFDREKRVFIDRMNSSLFVLFAPVTFDRLKLELNNLLANEEIKFFVHKISKNIALQKFALSCAIYAKRLQVRSQYLSLYSQYLNQVIKNILQTNQVNFELWQKQVALNFANWQNLLASNKVNIQTLTQASQLNSRLIDIMGRLNNIQILLAQIDALNIRRQALIVEQQVAQLKYQVAIERQQIPPAEKQALLVQENALEQRLSSLTNIFNALIDRAKAEFAALKAQTDTIYAQNSSLRIRAQEFQTEAQNIPTEAQVGSWALYTDFYGHYLSTFLELQSQYAETVNYFDKANLQLQEVCEQAYIELLRPYYYATEYVNKVLGTLNDASNYELRAAQDMANASLSAEIVESIGGG